MSHYISNFLVFNQLQGLIGEPQLSPLMRKRSITFDQLDQQRPLLSASEFAGLLRDCFEYFDDEAMGFTDKPLRTGTFRMMCLATLGCQNLRRVTLRIADFFRLISDEFQFSIEERGEEARFIVRFQPTSKNPDSFFVVTLFVILWRYMSWLIDAPMLLNRVYFTSRQSDLKSALEPVFECPIYFASQNNQLVFSSHYLSKPIKQTAESLSQFLGNAPECLMSHFQPQQSVSAIVKAELSRTEEFDAMTLDSMAKLFACSSQSLARKLRNEGHQFQQLKDKVRKGKTINLLLSSDLTISAISQQLGFSEEAVFYRTFKKWTGSTPNAYRQRYQR